MKKINWNIVYASKNGNEWDIGVITRSVLYKTTAEEILKEILGDMDKVVILEVTTQEE